MSVATRVFGAMLSLAAIYAQSLDQDSMAMVAHAYQLQQSGSYSEAAEAYKSFLKIHPGEVGVHSNLGVVLTKMGRYDEAIAEYEIAQRLQPGDARIVVNLALAYEKRGMLREATKQLTDLHAKLPQEQQVTLLLADAYLQAGQNGLVVDLLQSLEQQNPDDPALAYLLGTALIRQHRITEGQILLDRILKNGDTAESRFLLGMQMYESGDYPAAVKQFAAASQVNAQLPDLQSYYGQALLTTGDADGASQAFRRELEQNPYNFAANLSLGQILNVRKQFSEAEAVLKQALLIRPESTEVLLALGECLNGLDKWTEARQQLLEAINQDPNLAGAHRELADVDQHLRLTKEASQQRVIADRLQKSAEAQLPGHGLRVGELAPDFTLPDAATGKKVALHQFHDKNPVVLVFGSYSCPDFRDSARSLKELQTKYGDKATFFLVYIREAHGNEEWQSTRNIRDGVDVAPAGGLSEKQDHALICRRTLHLPFPALLDGLGDEVEAAYAAWPSRAFVIGRDGRIRYSSRLTENDFSAAAMETALQQAVTKRGPG